MELIEVSKMKKEKDKNSIVETNEALINATVSDESKTTTVALSSDGLAVTSAPVIKKEPVLLIADCDEDVIDLQIKQAHIIPRIRKRAERLANKIANKCDAMNTHDLDQELKELQSILNDLQHLKIVVTYTGKD